MSINKSQSVKKCKWCFEDINSSAVVCKHCNRHQRMFWQLFRDWPTLISFLMMTLAFLSYLEARKERIVISSTAQEVRKVANNVVKMSYIIADGSGRWDGMPKEHLDKLKEYQNEIKQSLDPYIDQQIRKDIEEVNKSMKLRIEKRK